MKGNRINIPAILMVMAILAIIAFQSYWMYKNYQEEEKTLQIRASAIFRNEAYRLQAENLKDDTSFRLVLPARWPLSGSTSGLVTDNKKRGRSNPANLPAVPEMRKKSYTDTTDSVKTFKGERIFIRAFSGKPDSNSKFRSSIPLDSLRAEQIRSISLKRKQTITEPFAADTGITISISTPSEPGLQFMPVKKLQGRVNSIDIQRGEPERTTARTRRRGMPTRVSIKTRGKDTLYEYMVLSQLMENGNFQNMLHSVDSLKDTVSLAELGKRFRDALDKESMKLDFVIRKDSLSMYGPDESIDPTQTSELSMGYVKDYYLRYHLLNTFQFITGKLSQQIILSLLLIALTSFTFVLLYRNMMKQRRLTQLKNELISNITHELKTPIATVSVAIEALKNFHAMDDPRRTEEYLDISGSELQRLSLLVDKVLRLSMFEKHQVELKMERFDLLQLTEEVMSSMRLQFEKAKATVQLHADVGDLSILADRLHITSVIFNLLDNALKYSSEKPDITVIINRTQNHLHLKISDNGIGIPAAYRKKVFDKFFRVPSGDTHNVKGYGLGLSYVAYVVERHNGSIEVESEPGQGSHFIIQLPGPI